MLLALLRTQLQLLIVLAGRSTLLRCSCVLLLLLRCSFLAELNTSPHLLREYSMLRQSSLEFLLELLICKALMGFPSLFLQRLLLSRRGFLFRMLLRVLHNSRPLQLLQHRRCRGRLLLLHTVGARTGCSALLHLVLLRLRRGCC